MIVGHFRDCEYNRNRATDEVIRDVIIRVHVVVCDEKDDSLLMRVLYEEVLEEFYHPLIGGIDLCVGFKKWKR